MSRQTVSKVVSDWCQLLMTDDVNNSLELMRTAKPNEVLDHCQPLSCTPLIKLLTHTHTDTVLDLAAVIG